jgi:co-chaperonin GroES (HSP10)
MKSELLSEKKKKKKKKKLINEAGNKMCFQKFKGQQIHESLNQKAKLFVLKAMDFLGKSMNRKY